MRNRETIFLNWQTWIKREREREGKKERERERKRERERERWRLLFSPRDRFYSVMIIGGCCPNNNKVVRKNRMGKGNNFREGSL
jgi:hypothetical protein